MSVKDGISGDDQKRFVIQIVYDEISCITTIRRDFEKTSEDRIDQKASSSCQSSDSEDQTWTGESSCSQDLSSDWWRGSWNPDDDWNSWKDSVSIR